MDFVRETEQHKDAVHQVNAKIDALCNIAFEIDDRLLIEQCATARALFVCKKDISDQDFGIILQRVCK